MKENQLSRYGAISRVVPDLAPNAKMFLVCDSDDTTTGVENLGAEFPVDKDGIVRVYTTIQSAVNACEAARGDVVLVMPGYDHTITKDSWDKEGVTILGLGEGTDKPIIRYADDSATVDIGASNVRVSGLRFLADADSIAIAVDADSGFSGLQFDNNIFDFDSNGQDFRVMLRLAQPRAVIKNNRFLAEDTAGSGRAISLKGNYDYAEIKNNFIYGQFDTVGDTTNGAAAIAQDTTDTTDTNVSGILIKNNTIISTDTASAVLIRFGGGGYKERGLLVGNRLGSYDTASEDTAIVSIGGLLPIDNKIINADSDTSEVIVGWSAIAP